MGHQLRNRSAAPCPFTDGKHQRLGSIYQIAHNVPSALGCIKFELETLTHALRRWNQLTVECGVEKRSLRQQCVQGIFKYVVQISTEVTKLEGKLREQKSK